MRRVVTMISAWTLLIALPAASAMGTEQTAESPGTQRIAFTSYVDGEINIWTMDDTGANLVQLTFGDSWDGGATWWGDLIAFGSNRQDDHHIWVMDSNGANPRILTAGAPTETEGEPAWSPNATHLVYVASGDLCGNQDLWVANGDGSDPVNITNTPTCDEWDANPDWSPDGDRIAFGSGAGGNPHIWLIDPDGGNAVNLTPDFSGSRHPSWSPDGSQIAFSKSCSIWVMDADGSDRHQVTAGTCDGQPAWSPDGSQIAFVSTRDGDAEIFTIDLATRAITQLTFNSIEDAAPAWQWPQQPTFECNGLAATIVGSEFDDHLIGTDDPDVIVGLAGHDRIEGLGGDDVICAGDGDDVVYGGDGRDRVLAGAGNDKIFGEGGSDRLYGEAGRDVLLGGWNRDLLDGGPGRDVLAGNGGNDFIRARDGEKDWVNGGSGYDRAKIDRRKDRVRNVEKYR